MATEPPAVQATAFRPFAEEEHIFKVLTDCAGSGDFYEAENCPVVKISGGYAQEIQVVSPPTVLMNTPFKILVRAIDSWGNIAKSYHSMLK